MSQQEESIKTGDETLTAEREKGQENTQEDVSVRIICSILELLIEWQSLINSTTHSMHCLHLRFKFVIIVI
jgi:hypothetical protein